MIFGDGQSSSGIITVMAGSPEFREQAQAANLRVAHLLLPEIREMILKPEIAHFNRERV